MNKIIVSFIFCAIAVAVSIYSFNVPEDENVLDKSIFGNEDIYDSEDLEQGETLSISGGVSISDDLTPNMDITIQEECFRNIYIDKRRVS